MGQKLDDVSPSAKSSHTDGTEIPIKIQKGKMNTAEIQARGLGDRYKSIYGEYPQQSIGRGEKILADVRAEAQSLGGLFGLGALFSPTKRTFIKNRLAELAREHDKAQQRINRAKHSEEVSTRIYDILGMPTSFEHVMLYGSEHYTVGSLMSSADKKLAQLAVELVQAERDRHALENEVKEKRDRFFQFFQDCYEEHLVEGTPERYMKKASV